MPQLPIYYIQYYNRKSQLVQLPETTTAGVLRKKVFFKILQNPQETHVPEENTCEFCKVSKKTIFTERLRKTASEMQTLQ